MISNNENATYIVISHFPLVASGVILKAKTCWLSLPTITCNLCSITVATTANLVYV